MPVTLDPDAAAVFKAFQEAGRPPYETVSPAEAREFYSQARFVSNPEPPELDQVQPLTIPSPAGPIPARIYTPRKVPQIGRRRRAHRGVRRLSARARAQISRRRR